MEAKKVKVTQVRGTVRRTREQKETLKGLGLGRIGRVSECLLTPSTIGMIKKVSHLVTVYEV